MESLIHAYSQVLKMDSWLSDLVAQNFILYLTVIESRYQD